MLCRKFPGFVFKVSLFSLMGLAVISCGKKDGSDDAPSISNRKPVTTPQVTPEAKPETKPETRPEFDPEKGEKFAADFTPMNSSVSGMIYGKIKIQRIQDEITVNVDVKNTSPRVMHAQNIYLSSSCPQDEHDINRDGFLDAVELSNALGEIIIPLDDDLGSQTSGLGIFPVADSVGSYQYQKRENYSKMMADLYLEDLDPKDNMRKIMPQEDFSLDGKVIVISGISSDIYLPPSVKSIHNESEHSSLPIGCAKLKFVKEEDSRESEETEISVNLEDSESSHSSAEN